VPDTVDDCPDIANPAIIPATFRQLDSDRDGLGDACDPAGSLDDDFDGIPDDLVTFAGTVACQSAPLGSLSVLHVSYQDIDGDHDPFPDPGETGLVQVRLQNNGAALTGASFVLSSSDPNVDCITFPRITVGSVPAGGSVLVGSLTPLQAGSSFTFRTGNGLQSVPGAFASLHLCVTVNSNEVLEGPPASTSLATWICRLGRRRRSSPGRTACSAPPMTARCTRLSTWTATATA